MFQNYFRTAWRNLFRQKVYTCINLLGLTLGITVCLVIFLLVRFEFSYDTFHADKNRIYRVVVHKVRFDGKKIDIGGVTSPVPDAMRNELSGLATVAGFDNLYANVIVPREGGSQQIFYAPKEGEEATPIGVVQPQYFDIFHFRWLAGNAATALNEPFRVVLTEKEATRYFGPQKNPEEWLGRRLIYVDSLPFTVSGIVADWQQNSDFQFRDFLSYVTLRHSFLKDVFQLDNWGSWSSNQLTVVKLNQGVTPAQVERQFSGFVKRHVSDPPGGSTAFALQPLSDVHFNEAYQDNIMGKMNLSTMYGLAAIAGFILLIAAINFINLSTAQSVHRAKEIGIRKVLGGRRGAIVLQFLSETLLVVLAAATLSLVLTPALLTAFHSMLPEGMGLDLFSGSTLLFLLLTVIITCLLAGLYPARVLSAFAPVLSLKGQGITQLNSKSYLRKSLIVFQFTVSLIFIIATLVIGRQIHYVLNTDLGFDKDAVIVLRTQYDSLHDGRHLLSQELREITGVRLVSQHMQTPAASGHWGTTISRTVTAGYEINSAFELCDTNYVPLFGLHIIAGRNLFPSDSIREFLINETCSRQLGFQHPADAIGHMVYIGINHGQGPVVGVIKDFHAKSLHEAITPFFITSEDDLENSVSVKLSTEGRSVDLFSTMLTRLESSWKEVYPNKKFEYQFFDETIARLYKKEQKTAQIMNIAMAVAILISCMGLFGLAAFTAKLRTKEIGIRKVLGATVTDIVTMLSADFVRLVVIAIVIASPVAYYFMQQWLQDFAYRVPLSWWIYVLAGGGAVGIAVLTVSWQAIRAATANPVDSLESE
jgi:ABC-type antimicrobial peptide transport system permease subunit